MPSPPAQLARAVQRAVPSHNTSMFSFGSTAPQIDAATRLPPTTGKYGVGSAMPDKANATQPRSGSPAVHKLAKVKQAQNQQQNSPAESFDAELDELLDEDTAEPVASLKGAQRSKSAGECVADRNVDSTPSRQEGTGGPNVAAAEGHVRVPAAASGDIDKSDTDKPGMKAAGSAVAVVEAGEGGAGKAPTASSNSGSSSSSSDSSGSSSSSSSSSSDSSSSSSDSASSEQRKDAQ
jgi:hypothetical protein